MPRSFFPAVPLSLFLLCAFFVTPGIGLFSPGYPKDVPLDRLIRNAEAHLAENPREGHRHYILGRIHALAFAQRSLETIEGIFPATDEKPPRVEEFKLKARPPGIVTPDKQPAWMRSYFNDIRTAHLGGLPGRELSTDEAKEMQELVAKLGGKDPEAEKARTLLSREQGLHSFLEQLRQTSDLSPEQNRALQEVFGKVFHRDGILPLLENAPTAILEEVWRHRALMAHFHQAHHHYRQAVELSPESPPFLLGLAWSYEVAGRKKKAIQAYRKVFRLTHPATTKKKQLRFMIDGWHGCFALEAGEALRRLLKGTKGDHEEEIQTLTKQIEGLESKLAGYTTPILVPLTGAVEYESLIAPDRVVSFDLRGGGKKSRWTWFHPRAGLLVWDPDGTKKVSSGRQLFGNTTWWVFWGHGYQPLRLLDDDGSGWLEGAECEGLAIWRDANQNGLSEPGEVRSLAAWKVERICVRSSGKKEGIHWAEQGVEFTDGTIRPTYDWVAREIAPTPAGDRSD